MRPPQDLDKVLGSWFPIYKINFYEDKEISKFFNVPNTHDPRSMVPVLDMYIKYRVPSTIW